MEFPKQYKKVFITGGAGFIGSHLTEILVNKGIAVTVFDNLSTGKYSYLKPFIGMKNFKFIKGDLLDQKLLNDSLKSDIDLVFHLAANADVSKGFKNPIIDFNNTIVSTFNLLQAIKGKGIKRIVYFSGSGVYGNAGKKYTREDYGPLIPESLYGATKLSAEALICSFSNLYGISSWIFRPANIIGRRQTHGVIYDFINKLKNNPRKLEILGDGNQSKSYVHVVDLLDAVFITLTKRNKGINIYNVSSNNFLTVNKIAKLVIKSLGLTKVSVTHTKGPSGWPGDVPVVRLDCSKLLKEGWSPKHTSIQAVRRTLEELLP